jgi:hypothetical protein
MTSDHRLTELVASVRIFTRVFYGFSLERHVPNDHLLRKIDCFVGSSGNGRLVSPRLSHGSTVARSRCQPKLFRPSL